MMRSLLLLWPKPPAIKPPFTLDIKGNRLRGKVTPSHNGDTHRASKKIPCGAKRETTVSEWATVGCRQECSS